MGFPRFFGTPKPERIPSQDVNDERIEASQPPAYQSSPSIDRTNSLKLTWNVDEQPSTEYKSETASLNASLNGSYNDSYSDGHHNVPKLWNSVWLRTRLLVSFVVLFLVLFVVTVILYGVSEKYHGLSAEDVTRQYGWRYGPTAFLAIVLSLWAQIDYSSKVLAPWQEMRRGPTDASRSVLVDYISPPMLIVWWRALKSHHWAVTASISGILLIQLATVFSTGLFVLEPTTLDMDDVPITVKSAFNGSDFSLTNSSTTISTGPSLLYYGSRVNGLTSSPGVDISRGLVVPDLTPSDKFTTVNGTNYTAVVPGAQASFDCEYLPGLNATKTSLPWWSILGAFFVMNITTPSCNISSIIVGEGPDHNIYHQPDATQAYMGYFGDYLCDPSIDYSFYENLPDPSNTTVEHRIVMTMADLRFSPYDAYSAGPDYIYLENLTVAVCKSGYTMSDYEVTYKNGIDGQSKSWMTDEVSALEEDIPGFFSEQLGAAVQSSLDETYLGTGGQDWVLTKQVPTFYQILSAMNGNVSIGHFMDYEKLISSATDAFKGISAELISQHMMKPSESNVIGSILYQEDRLWVRALSVGFMAAAFLLLAGLTVVLLIFRPKNVVPSDPGSIGATALILAESSALRSLLSGLGAARTRDIKGKLSSYNFRSVIAPGAQKTFTVVPTEHGQQTDSKGMQDDSSPPQAEHWWVPSAARLWFQAIAIALPLIIIAVLEVIQRLSDKNNGFVDLGSGGFATTHGFATYIPAVVAFIVATMFTSMQLAVCILSPWLALHRGSAPASRSLFLNLINRLAPHRIFLAFKNGKTGEVLIMIATFLAAWLPILVSGLYVTVPATSSHTVSLAQSDLFDFKLNNLFYDDNLAGTVAGLIAYKGLAYPKWTYDDLAFNTLDATGVPTDMSKDTAVPFAAKMQALRPSLTCEVVSPDSMTARWDSQASQSLLQTDDAVALNLTFEVPWMCESPRGNTTNLPWFQGFALPANGSSIYFGHASVLSWGDRLYGNRATITDLDRSGAVSYTPEAVANWVGGYGCPSFAVTLGRGSAISKVSQKNQTSYSFDVDVTSILCSQRIEVVHTNVTLSLPPSSLGIVSPDTPPGPDEATARFLINRLSNYTGPVFEFPLNNLLLTLTDGTGNVTIPAPKGSPKTSEANQLDDFVKFLATTNASLPIEALVGEANVQNLIEATNKLYKTYMPQAIDRNMRTTDLHAKIATPDSPSANVEAMHTTARPAFPGRLRLKQEAAPKFALQAVLAFMVLCALVSRLFLRDIEKLVPHNPCSIAGRAALFADGEVSTRKLVPYGAEWRTEAELSRVGVYEGWLFSLGWWESFGVYKYGVDIGWIDQGSTQGKGAGGHDI